MCFIYRFESLDNINEYFKRGGGGGGERRQKLEESTKKEKKERVMIIEGKRHKKSGDKGIFQKRGTWDM